MQTRHKLLLIAGGTSLSATLAYLSVYLLHALIDLSGRQGFGFFGSGMLYVLVPIAVGFFGLLLCIALLQANSLARSLLYSVAFSLFTSIVFIKDIFLKLAGEETFDKLYFQLDIFAVCSNFVIYPAVAFLFWKAKNRLTQGYQ